MYNGDYTGAEAWYRTIIDSGNAPFHAHRAYQDALFAQGDSARLAAETRYHGLLQGDSTNPQYLYLYGRCLKCAGATAYFDRALERNKCFEWALNAKGACYFEQGDYHRAKEQFLRAMKCDRDFAEAYRNLAAVYAQQGEFRRAKKVFRTLVARGRENGQTYEWLGDMYLAQKQWDYARLAYRKAAGFGREGPAVYFKLGYACFQKKTYAEAVDAYRASIDRGNATCDVLYNIASAYEQMERYENAIDNYRRVFDACGDTSVLYSVGTCAVFLGLHSLAIRSYELFLRSRPGHIEAEFGLANAYQLRKDFRKAIEIYEKILAQDSSYANAYYNLGSIYAYHVKDPAAMRRYWKAFVERFPEHEDAGFIRTEMEKILSMH
jgi:tetratricopeptide (TPR) repeat protein